MKFYEKTFEIRWADLDPNFHLRHTAYGDMCAATRFQYLASLGFTIERFAEIKVGPVIFKETISYLKEVRPNDRVRVNCQICGLSEDGRKWKMFHEIFRESDGEMSATLEIDGAWLDIVKRKIAPPPEDLKQKMNAQPRPDNFAVIG
ncbi:MAG: thioesterase family protein [Bdellovibrionales bacterium]|nr:thioesterase family protein [Bdellovibrionales bacterium]NQZ18642.1 thioesterase family protein [Bdellovibrionales bacterium]